MNTPGPTCSCTGPNAAVPMRCCNGTRRERAVTSLAVALEELVVGRSSEGQPATVDPGQVSGQLLGIATGGIDSGVGE